MRPLLIAMFLIISLIIYQDFFTPLSSENAMIQSNNQPANAEPVIDTLDTLVLDSLVLDSLAPNTTTPEQIDLQVSVMATNTTTEKSKATLPVISNKGTAVSADR
ncbi:MAG: hypothetical protein KUG79_11455 [Pseudomonadales bacterium]|nr:hypothetical protein [Pseudomonadales bacterium]